MKPLNEGAADLLQGCETVIPSSVNQEGYPRPVPLSKIVSEGTSEVWMVTGERSVRTKDFRSNSKAGLCLYEQGNSVALTSEVEAVIDAGLKQKHWQG